MKILISNDDGVHAEGIKALYGALKDISDVTVVAPLEERSTTSHTLTLDSPLRIVKLSEDTYGCSGFPADCTVMGIGHILKDRPDLIISGINRGANLGQDIYYSGTVAAAREGVFRSIPAIAVSTVLNSTRAKNDKIHFETAALFVRELVKKEVHKIIQPMGLLNINAPDIPSKDLKGATVTELGFQRYSEEISQRRDFKDRDYFWIGGRYLGFHGNDLSDCNVVDQGRISITPLNLLQKPTDMVSQMGEKLTELISQRLVKNEDDL